jgi:monoamine oxidase
LKTDTIIIGGGVAGLAVAGELIRAGQNVLLLEARDRLGGRILTHCEPGLDGPVELGAEFVHGKPPQLFDLIDAAGLDVVEGADRRLISDHGGLRPLENFWDIIEAVDSQIPAGLDSSYEQFLPTASATAFQKQISKSYVEGFNAARADLISTAALKFEEGASEKIEATKQFRITRGYASIVERLARPLPPEAIRTGCVVRAVRCRKGHVEIAATAGGESLHFSAARAVVTLPLGVLRASIDGEPDAITFDPPLTSKREPISHLEVGHVVKTVMQFREKFWEDPDVGGRCAPFGFALCLEAEFPTWWTQAPTPSNLITGWAGGPAADKLIGRDRKQLRAAAFASLSQTFHIDIDRLRSLFVRDHFHDWARDPFALGAYTYPKIGGLRAAKILGEPIDDTLFFAGEATDTTGFNGTVHGALASGSRAAREILAL